jgi:hypothetical protein
MEAWPIMVAAISPSQSQFYREFLMARGKFDPKEFGVEMSADDFKDTMVSDFADYTRGQIALDEFLLHPRDVLRFCDEIRHKHGWWHLPDDIILRSIMNRRKGA